ncbi:hypothetical protein ACLRGI_06880 [Paenarthrobacter nitroguajacolicus]|uniref:hypothetical protein n=1 Tax=Paenarthrobacter nitroguajacolicus TaxID=211146 RepID=UPI003AEEAC3C
MAYDPQASRSDSVTEQLQDLVLQSVDVDEFLTDLAAEHTLLLVPALRRRSPRLRRLQRSCGWLAEVCNQSREVGGVRILNSWGTEA